MVLTSFDGKKKGPLMLTRCVEIPPLFGIHLLKINLIIVKIVPILLFHNTQMKSRYLSFFLHGQHFWLSCSPQNVQRILHCIQCFCQKVLFPTKIDGFPLKLTISAFNLKFSEDKGIAHSISWMGSVFNITSAVVLAAGRVERSPHFCLSSDSSLAMEPDLSLLSLLSALLS